MRYFVLILLLISCHPVSHIVVGKKREATNPTDVKVYLDYPESYEKIALVDAGSNFSFKDPVILFAWQSKMNKALERLKEEAASLGANGILIVNTDNKTYQQAQNMLLHNRSLETNLDSEKKRLGFKHLRFSELDLD